MDTTRRVVVDSRTPMMTSTRFASLAVPSLALVFALSACDDSPATADASTADVRDASAGTDVPVDRPTFDPAELLAPGEVTFARPGPRGGAMGRGSFTFGVATAATQIEDQNVNTDWYLWTRPTEMGGLGRGTFVNDAVQGFTRATEDVGLLAELGVDTYRFSVEWSRVEPRRNMVDESALAHYGRVLDALRMRNIRPSVTVHHFSNPVWVDDPRRTTACTAPSDTDLCGWDHPQGADLIIAELREHAALLARRYGDRVDEWATLNEPINYLLASYGTSQFPPGRNLLFQDPQRFVAAVRNFIRAHVAVYEAIKANDTMDADGDGVNSHVGFTLSVADWVPARSDQPSTDAADIAARDRVRYVYHHLFVEALRRGAFDADLDMNPEETHPEWRDRLEWLGVQYYFRAGVSSFPAVVPLVRANVCINRSIRGACLDAVDATHWVPTMRYEYFAPGLYNVLRDFGTRWPDLPLTVTEGGIATEVGARRAQNIVRTLEQIERARRDGVDVRGYYHWSLMDNFEWAEGYHPRFGLYRVERTGTTYSRTATTGATVYRDIIRARTLTTAQRAMYGGLGPMTPEP